MKILLYFLDADWEVPGSIPSAAIFSESQWVWNVVHSFLVRIKKSSGSGLEN
jgi:hypothetical protein